MDGLFLFRANCCQAAYLRRRVLISCLVKSIKKQDVSISTSLVSSYWCRIEYYSALSLRHAGLAAWVYLVSPRCKVCDLWPLFPGSLPQTTWFPREGSPLPPSPTITNTQVVAWSTASSFKKPELEMRFSLSAALLITHLNSS